jgi:hypothetical protein
MPIREAVIAVVAIIALMNSLFDAKRISREAMKLLQFH